MDTFASDQVVDDRLILYHYITKSQQARGRAPHSWAGGCLPWCCVPAVAALASSLMARHNMHVPGCPRHPAGCLVNATQDFEQKMARGDGMGRKDRKQDYFDQVQQQ